MKVNEITLSASELGAVLGVGDRRIRQLGESGIIPRAARGRYPLVEGVQAYIAELETRTDAEDLRRERIALIRQQTRRLTLANEATEATTASVDFMEALTYAFHTYLVLRLQPIAGWAHAALFERTSSEIAREVASDVATWTLGAVAEARQQLMIAVAEARRRGTLPTDYYELERLMRGAPAESETEDS